jgi:hypothetical protein
MGPSIRREEGSGHSSSTFLSLHIECLIRNGPHRKHSVRKFCCCVCIRCFQDVFIKPLSSNWRLFWIYYSGFQTLEMTYGQQGDIISLIFSLLYLFLTNKTRLMKSPFLCIRLCLSICVSPPNFWGLWYHLAVCLCILPNFCYTYEIILLSVYLCIPPNVFVFFVVYVV